MPRSLKIQFYQYFFLQNYQRHASGGGKTRGGVVILPSKRHRVRLYRGNKHRPFLEEPLQVNVERVVEGRRQVIWNEPTDRPGRGCLLDMDVISNQRTTVQRKYLAEPAIPDEVNARVVLAGGTFQEVAAYDEDARGKGWLVKDHLGNYNRQRLTDRLDFTMTLDDRCDYFLVFRRYDEDEEQFIVVDEYTLGDEEVFTFWNCDREHWGHAPRRPAPGTYLIDEYVPLVGMTSLGNEHLVIPFGDYPIPQEDDDPGCDPGEDLPVPRPTPVRSATDPICGGAQGGDDDGDPEDPPMP